MFEHVEIWQILLANAAILLGSFIQSGTGFGLGLIAVPLLTFINPIFTPGAFLFSSLFQNMVMAERNRDGIRKEWLGYFFPGLFLGAFLIYPVIGYLKGPGAQVAIGVTILVAVGISASGFSVALNRRNLVVGAALAGVMSTIAAIIGPPLILLLQNEKGIEIRANLAVTFLVGTVASLIALHFAGRFEILHLTAGVALLPGIFLGSLLGARFASFLDARCLRPVLLSLVGFGGAALIVKNLMFA